MMNSAFVPFVALGVFFLLVGTPQLLAYLMRRQRDKRMMVAAAEQGFEFAHFGDFETETEMAACQLLSRKSGGYVRNLMRGTSDGLVVKVFDYKYSNGRGDPDRGAHTVIFFRSAELALPAFTVRRKNLFHRIAALFGYRGIRITNHPTFRANYLLRGKDEAAVRRLFDDDVVSHFERGKTLSAEADGIWFMLCWPEWTVGPQKVPFLVQEGFEVLALFWRTSSRGREELPHDFRHRFGVRIAGNVAAVPQGHPTGIRQAP